MKTAISVPDGTFERASRRAEELCMSRSELFTRAVDNYLDELDARSTTDHVNAALARIGGMDESSKAAVDATHAMLLGVDDEW